MNPETVLITKYVNSQLRSHEKACWFFLGLSMGYSHLMEQKNRQRGKKRPVWGLPKVRATLYPPRISQGDPKQCQDWGQAPGDGFPPSLVELNYRHYPSPQGLVGKKARAGRGSGSSRQETLRTVVVWFFSFLFFFSVCACGIFVIQDEVTAKLKTNQKEEPNPLARIGAQFQQ